MKTRRSPRRYDSQLRLQRLEDRTVPTAVNDLLGLIGLANTYSGIVVPTPSPNDARAASLQTLVQSAGALTSKTVDVSLSLASTAIHGAALAGYPPAVQISAAQSGLEQAALFANVAVHTQEFNSNPSFLTAAPLFADITQVFAHNGVKLIGDLVSLKTGLAEWHKAAGVFGTAVTSFLDPQQRASIKSMTIGAQTAIENETAEVNSFTQDSFESFFDYVNQAVDSQQTELQGLQNAAVDPNFAEFVPPFADQLMGSAERIQGVLDDLNQAADDAVTDSQQALDEIGAAATTETIESFNEQVLALDQLVAGLPPDVQQAVAQAVQDYKFQLADGATVQLSKHRDYIGGEQVANITFVSQLNSITVPLFNRTRDIHDQADHLNDDDGGGGGGGGGGQTDVDCQGMWKDDTSDALPGTPSRVFITVNASGGTLHLNPSAGSLSGNGTFTVTSTRDHGFSAVANGNFVTPGGRTITTFNFRFGCSNPGAARFFDVTDANGQLLDNTLIGIDLVPDA